MSHPGDSQVIAPSFVREDDRGLFFELVNEGPWETIIYGSMKAGKKMGDHYHRECRALFYLQSGRAEVRIRRLIDESTQKVTLEAKQGIYFLPFEVHTIEYLEPSDFMLLKSYRYDSENPDIYPENIEQSE